MAGYSRQSAASIVPTAVVRATPINDEFNALRDAFVVASGHKHDGTATEGAYIPLISDPNARNKLAVDTGNNRLGVFVNVSGSSVEQLRFVDGAIVPVTDNDIDLGSATFEFKDLYIDGIANIDSLTADSATILGGTINAATIGNSTPAAGTFTNLTVTSSATIASAAISAGTINGTVIGGTTPQAITGTTITANVGFVGGLTGAVSGNVTGNLTGDVTGNVTGNLTGNVTASSGTSTFNNVTVTGTLNMDAGTIGTITNLSTPTNSGDAATKGYVDTSISNLIASSPATLDTLNELAAALGNDPNFATTVTNSIAGKLSLTGGTMSGVIAMGSNKITGVSDPTNPQDAATKTYVDTQRDTRLALTGGTLTGSLALSGNRITSVGDPLNAQDVVTKNYVDSTLGSTLSAAASAAAAATSASNAATSASNASTSATNAASSASSAASSAASAAASYDSFDDRYLGPKASMPALDNDGNALLVGALYFDTTANELRVWTGSTWITPSLAINGTSQRQVYIATQGQTVFSATYTPTFVDVYYNGVKLVSGTDFTASNGTSITLSFGANANDTIDIVAYGTFSVANVYTTGQADARYLQLTGGTLTGTLTFAAGQTIPGYYTTTQSDARYYTQTQADSRYLQLAGGTLTGGVVFAAGQTFPGTATLTGAETISNKTVQDAIFTDGYIEETVTANTGSAYTISLANGTLQILTLTANCTFTFPTATTGRSFVMILRQDGTGSRTVTWPAAVRWPAGTAPTITSTANRADKYVFTANGSVWIGSNAGQNYTL